MIQLFALVVVAFVLYLLLKPSRSKKEEGIYIRALERYLYLSTHSYERLNERRVSLRRLKEMLESKESTALVQKNGRIRVSDGKLTAILGIDGDDLVLVTVFRNSRNDRKRR